MDATILKRIVEIQIEQGDLLKRLVRMTAIREISTHVYLYHGGDNLQEASNAANLIVARFEQNQDELRKLVSELCSVSAPAVS